MPTPIRKKNEAKTDFLKRCTNERIENGDDSRTAFSKCAANLGADLSSMHLAGPVQMLEEENKKKRSFLISAKTGTPVVQWGWTTVIDIAGIKTEARMPVLREHERDRVVGQGQPFVDGNTLFVEGEFSSVTIDAKEVLDLADEGYPWQASIGVWAKKVKTIEAGVSAVVNGIEINGPADIWTESYVREVSFVTLGADEATIAIAMAEDHKNGKNSKERKETMDIKKLKEDHPELVEVIFREAFEKGKAEGINEERARVTEILGADADLAETKSVISDGTPAGEAYKAFFEAERAKRADGLKALEAEATPPQGVSHRNDDPNPEANMSADKVLSYRAKKLSKEQAIPYKTACKQVLREDSELSEKYRSLYN